jgi:hypothetical protein
MTTPRSIGILLHERDGRALERSYILWPVARIWKGWGIEVRFLSGPRGADEVEALVPHVDLTAMPPEYAAALEAHPCAVNRNVRDLSKRRVSRNLVGPGDAWDGPVLVKTDRNHGGYPDHRLLEPTRRKERSLARAFTLRPDAYPVFPSLAAVPRAVFSNPRLVVERFLPERDGDLYCVRSATLLGDHEDCQLKKGTSHVVRAARVVARERVPLHPAMREAARGLGLDYGKIDYVERDGETILLDATATPTRQAGPLTESAEANARARAEAALALFERLARGPTHR